MGLVRRRNDYSLADGKAEEHRQTNLALESDERICRSCSKAMVNLQPRRSIFDHSQTQGLPTCRNIGQKSRPRRTTWLEAEALTKRLIGTKWVWFGGETITFLADGKAEWSTGKQIWPWKVTSVGLRVIEGMNMARTTKFTITFEHDPAQTDAPFGRGRRRVASRTSSPVL